MSLPTQVSTLPRSSTHVAPERDRASRAERTREIVCRLADCQDEDERLDLTNELAAVNMPVADSVVTRYRARGIATEDLKQVAYLALTKAARRFDPRAGHDFLSFCVPTIRGEVRRYFRDKGWMVRPPRRIQELQQRLTAAQADLTTHLGRPPNVDELAQHLDEDPADVREAMDGQGCFTPTSLDRPIGDDQSVALGELIGVEDADRSAAEARVALAPVVRRLSARDRHILELRFFEGLTQREIAEDIGVTQMQVSRLLSRIFRDLRKDLGVAGERGVGDD
jgi:RNA polymerase sigma-B factor